jgi:hypothetical protein
MLLAAFVAGLAAALWYLRDPAWLAGQTTGLRGWQRDADGTPGRWSGGHASFFVPADAKQIRVPMSTTFDARQPRGDAPMLVTLTIDDTRAGRVLLNDEARRDVVLDMPAPGSRRVRRVDVRTSITRDGNFGVKIGAMSMTADGVNWRPCCLSPR